MKISIFLELALPRPWSEDAEFKLFQENLDIVEAADKAGFSTAWITEHHFMEEYSHSSAPELFLAAASQRTKNIRLGHGIMHMPPQINHPARVAERISTLDQISGGRVEFGTGEASSVAELGGFVVDAGKKRAQWIESVRVATRAMTEVPFTGYLGEHVEMPPRNVVPKPFQKPHPPLWVACTTHQTAIMAAENGIGALNFSRLGPEVLVDRVKEYYEIFEERAVPIAPGINANFLAAVGDLAVMLGDTMDEAIERSGLGAGFFGFGVKHYYTQDHHPGVDNIWAELEEAVAHDPSVAYGPDRGPIGTPEYVRDFLKGYEETGVDEVMFLLNPANFEGTLESIERMGREVLPEFHDRDEKYQAEKERRMAPVYEAAEARRRPHPDTPPYDPDYTFGGLPVSFDGTYVAREGQIAQQEHEMERLKRAAQQEAASAKS
jgi:alkanesulfonate monooxygenase SsuD/methylene tetrahydromethanopterin reductase-like flavin-dependent oxidoreductase (luciferase family)